MTEPEADLSLFQLLGYVGLPGMLTVISACIFGLVGLVSMLFSKRWYVHVLVFGVVSTLAWGYLARWSAVVKSNNEILASGGQANIYDVARSLAVADYGPLIAFYGCVVLCALIALGSFLGKHRPSGPRLTASILSSVCFVSLAIGTSQLSQLNDHISTGFDLILPTPQDLVGEGESSESPMIVKSSGQLAEFSGSLRPEFERALLYRGLGKWGLLGVVLFLLFSMRSKKGAAAVDPEA